MNWIILTHEQQLADITEKSKSAPQLIFKHSTRCSISTMVKKRLENTAQSVSADYYYLDLLQYRSVSNKIAEMFCVHHESPQILLIQNGACTYDESHNGITTSEIEAQIKS